jgi:hypothetical protein
MIRQFKIFFARREAAILENRTRRWRRAFRDYHRMESDRIRQVAIRARGLRLFAAWSSSDPSDWIHQPTTRLWKPASQASRLQEAEFVRFQDQASFDVAVND